MARAAVARFVRRLDGVLGRLAFRTVGIVLLVPTVAAVRGLWGAVTVGDIAGVFVAGALTGVFGSAVAFCFSPKRRLSDTE